MKPKDDPKLKALQKIWYEKLRKSGFNDIEDVNSPRELLKQWHSTYFYRHYTVESFQEKQDYWRQCSHFLHLHTFEDSNEQKIFELYCEGLSFREIATSIRTKKNKWNKDSINKIVSKLLKIMNATPEAMDE